jgi:hypothetical protein
MEEEGTRVGGVVMTWSWKKVVAEAKCGVRWRQGRRRLTGRQINEDSGDDGKV